MLGRLGKIKRVLRDMFSRSEWAVRHLRKKRYADKDHAVHTPGVLIIQIDGLGYEQLLRGIEKKRLPFLQRMIQEDNFVLRKFYSGLPSATPAVQAELFFGVKSAVPAFKYFDRLEREERVMFEAQSVDRLAVKLEKSYEGLLAGGSSYSNIFTGGADEARFCIQTMDIESIFHDISLRKLAWFIISNLEKLLRIIGLSIMEFAIAVFDFIKGLYIRNNLYKEFKFMFSRIGASIVLRELLRLHVKMDIARGLPIIHANFVGYDEHSHRRNPSSAFAHWTLKGIDATIGSLVRKAIRSDKRDYQVFIYSDHGQEPAIPYIVRNGRTLREAIGEIFSQGPLRDCNYDEPESLIPHAKLHQRSKSFLFRTEDIKPDDAGKKGDHRIHITAMGPLGHIYLPFRPEAGYMRSYAEQMVRRAGIPLVLYMEDDTVICVNKSGAGDIREKGREIFGADHPFLQEVVEDMQRICRHVNAGDFVISGWQPQGGSLTFPMENGSHGGPGVQETTAFAILPDIVNVADKTYLRPLDLRKHIRRLLAGKTSDVPAVRTPDHVPEIIRIMTYNIHSCIGMDGKLFPARIARIISRQSPDIVALQEVDRNMERTGYQDQSQLLAENLDMQHCYFPILKKQEGEYGLAILSRFPFKVMACRFLSRLSMAGATEKRGIMWIVADTHHGPVHLFNTHLSLVRRERIVQMQHIVEGTMLDTIPAAEPVLFCGDFNTGINSTEYNLLSTRLTDCQKMYPHLQPDPTFFSSYPLFRLDHIFHSGHLAPIRVSVINDWECRLASDHLPVLSVFMYDPDIRHE